jgi:putative tricarboxylic transport membrane protein
MAFRNRDKKDFNAGILYIVLGGFFAIFAKNYPMGTAVRMGPAYFPTFLGWMLAGLGLIIFVRSFFAHGEEPAPTHWRPLGLILISVVAFGFLLDHAGMIVASFALMFISGMGGWDFRWKEQLVNAVFMTAVNVAIFYYGLALPFNLFPWS